MQAEGCLEVHPKSQIEKDVVFISHATPEDNEFAIWLASHLKNAGYNVWLDKNKLNGGELFWDNIEENLKNKTIKVIAIISNVSKQKDGVKNEISYALGLEKKWNLNNFILPVLLEQTSTPIELNRRNYIDFSNNWGSGLSQVLEFLKNNNVPKDNNAETLSIFSDCLRNKVVPLEMINEVLISNMFRIIKLPQYLYFYKVKNNKKKQPLYKLIENKNAPIREFYNLLCSFLNYDDTKSALYQNVEIELIHKINLQDFLNGHPLEYRQLQNSDAKKLIISLIAKSLNLFFCSKKLNEFWGAKGSTWWVPKDLISKDKVNFTNFKGEQTYRVLVGKSKNYFWHFGITIKVLLEPELSIMLKPSIIYTTDGSKMIADDKKQNRLRISRTKMWFNAKWRDLILAFMFWISENEKIKIRVGTDDFIEIDNAPISFDCPIGINEQKLTSEVEIEDSMEEFDDDE